MAKSTDLLNSMAEIARLELALGNQQPFSDLYHDPQINTIRKAIIAKYARQSTVLNKHDLEALFDDVFLDCIDQYRQSSGKLFVGFIDSLFRFRHNDMLKSLTRHRRSAFLYSNELYVDTAVEDDITVSKWPASNDDTEFEALLEVACDDMDARTARLVRGLSSGKFKNVLEAAEPCGFRNRQQAYRALKTVRELVG